MNGGAGSRYFFFLVRSLIAASFGSMSFITMGVESFLCEPALDIDHRPASKPDQRLRSKPSVVLKILPEFPGPACPPI